MLSVRKLVHRWDQFLAQIGPHEDSWTQSRCLATLVPLKKCLFNNFSDFLKQFQKLSKDLTYEKLIKKANICLI